MIDDGFPPTRDEWLIMRDRAQFAEDRVRIIRDIFGEEKLPKFLVTWTKGTKVRAALVELPNEVPQ